MKIHICCCKREGFSNVFALPQNMMIEIINIINLTSYLSLELIYYSSSRLYLSQSNYYILSRYWNNSELYLYIVFSLYVLSNVISRVILYMHDFVQNIFICLWYSMILKLFNFCSLLLIKETKFQKSFIIELGLIHVSPYPLLQLNCLFGFLSLVIFAWHWNSTHVDSADWHTHLVSMFF